jgi:hypothetical protein
VQVVKWESDIGRLGSSVRNDGPIDAKSKGYFGRQFQGEIDQFVLLDHLDDEQK